MTPDAAAVDPALQDGAPRYNIAPTQPVVCIVRESTGQPRIPISARWGLVPNWANDIAIGNRLINARAETVDTKPSFRDSFSLHRCLIPADGYFEWKRHGKAKQPYLIEPQAGGMLAMAGLWEENRMAAETTIRSCTIITTAANQATGQLHDRMPVFLARRDHDRWLDPGYRDIGKLKQLLVPAPDDLLKWTAVSTRVNNSKNDDRECVEPLA